MPTILFICTANMCRSPMASAIMQKLVAPRVDAGEWNVESAGVWAEDGFPACKGAIMAMAERGLDLSGHLTRSVNRALVRDADLVLVMEGAHQEALQAEFPQYSARVYLLSAMVEKTHDIRDPIGGSRADFAETAWELERILTQGMGRIEALAGATTAGSHA